MHSIARQDTVDTAMHGTVQYSWVKYFTWSYFGEETRRSKIGRASSCSPTKGNSSTSIKFVDKLFQSQTLWYNDCWLWVSVSH